MKYFYVFSGVKYYPFYFIIIIEKVSINFRVFIIIILSKIIDLLSYVIMPLFYSKMYEICPKNN